LNSSLFYDFSNLATQAFGNNLMCFNTGQFGIESGDMANDASINNIDFSIWEANANNFVSVVQL